LVVAVTLSERKRRNYEEIIHYRRSLNPVLRSLSLIGGTALAATGIGGIVAGYVVLGEYLTATGLIAVIPGVFIRTKKFEHIEKQFDEDSTLVSGPARNADVDVEVDGTSRRLRFTSDSLGRVAIPMDSLIGLRPDGSEIRIIARLVEDTSARIEYTMTPHFVSVYRMQKALKVKAEAERERKEQELRRAQEAQELKAEAERKKREEQWHKKLVHWVSYAEQYGDEFRDRWLDWGDYAIDQSLYFYDDMQRAAVAGYSPSIVATMARSSYDDAVAYLIVNRICNERLLTTWGGDDFCSAVRRAVAALYGGGR
jgi:hypothetical protein